MIGRFGECAIARFTLRTGLRRRASAKADFASSILPAAPRLDAAIDELHQALDAGFRAYMVYGNLAAAYAPKELKTGLPEE